MKKAELITRLAMEGFSAEIVSAFEKVNREKFVLPDYQSLAYDDIALPIGYGQTISQPYTIAFMLYLLQVTPGLKIMEVGSGSGYVLALLSELTSGGKIYGVEIVFGLVARSRINLRSHKNITIRLASKKLGLSAEAPFDRILVSAAANILPEELIKQLGKNGIMVCPVKNSILKITKQNEKYKTERYEGFSFVPLITL
jgi:protein-L-isoaspartate(D-aspartate) O-methyltransferase